MESKSQAMEKAIDGQYYCQRLLHHDIISYTLLDMFAFFILSIIVGCIKNKLVNRILFRPSLIFLILSFLCTYLLEKLFPKYIALILSYIYISVCKSILSILKIDFSVVTRNIFHASTMEKVVSLFSPLSITQRPTIMEKFSHGSLCQVFKSFTSLFLTMDKVLNLLFSPLSLTMDKVFNLLLSPLFFQDSVPSSFISLVINYSFMALETFFPEYIVDYLSFLASPDSPSRLHLLVEEELINNDTKIETTHKQDIGIKRGEVGFVLSNIGISLSKEVDQIKDCMTHEEFSTLFDHTEPSLHEVEEAFSVFDQNRDGFIDAKELQTVLINIGLREGTDVDACQSMIDRHDHNRKQKIDLSDFLKLLESALL